MLRSETYYICSNRKTIDHVVSDVLEAKQVVHSWTHTVYIHGPQGHQPNFKSWSFWLQAFS